MASPTPVQRHHPMTSSTPRFGPIRFRLLLVACSLLGASGCLDWEKQTILIVFPKDRDEVHALLVYEGFRVGEGSSEGGGNLTRAKDDLTKLMTSQTEFYLGGSAHDFIQITRIDLAELKDEDEKQWLTKRKAHLRKHVTISKGILFTNKQGKLCGTQEITIRELAKFVDGLNSLISEEVADWSAKQIAAGKDASSGLDLLTLQLMQQASRNKHAWVKLEPGRVSVSIPASPQTIQEIKRVLRGGDFFAGAVEGADLKLLRKSIKEYEKAVRTSAANPWSLDHRKDRLIVSLGLGEGEPILVVEERDEAAPARYVAELDAHARSLPLKFRKDESREALLDEFKRAKLGPNR